MNPLQKQLTQLYRKQHLLGVLLFSLVTIVIWIGLSLISSQTKTSLSPTLQQLAKPLSPTLNTAVIDEIEAKTAFTTDELQAFPIYQVLSGQSIPAAEEPTPGPDSATDLTTLTQSSETPVTSEEVVIASESGTTTEETVTNSNSLIEESTDKSTDSL